jgi:hypothetical protein
MPKKDWQVFEKIVGEELGDEFPLVLDQQNLPSGRRPDFLASDGKNIIVGDAKDKAVLTYNDVEQMADYADEIDADQARIYVAADTHISDNIHEYAEEEGIDIYEIPDWRK